jgi:hypothetical protein
VAVYSACQGEALDSRAAPKLPKDHNPFGQVHSIW